MNILKKPEKPSDDSTLSWMNFIDSRLNRLEILIYIAIIGNAGSIAKLLGFI